MALSARAQARVILLVTVLGVALTANLGAWQLRRAAVKVAMRDALLARADSAPLAGSALATDATLAAAQHYRPTRLRGRWLAQYSVFLDNRQMQDRFGFYLVTPLQLEGRPETVLVQRGWAPRDLLERTRLPAVATPTGPVQVDGHIAPPPARLYEFAGAQRGAIRQNIDVASFSAETGLRLLPLSVQQDDAPGTAGDGLLRQWPRPAVDVQMHYGYAAQWFAMCALMLGLYVWFQLVRPRLARHAGA